VNKTILEFLMALFEEMDPDARSWGFEAIVDEPKGDREDRDGNFFDHVYIDQTCGPCEDDFQGTVYIPVTAGKYLACWYAC
jgi:hypothetical protein